MVIKDYWCLTKEEKILVNKFRDTDFTELAEEKVYDYGKGMLFAFEGQKPMGSVLVVLEAAEMLKTAYIYRMAIEGENVDIFKELMKIAVNTARKYGARRIFLGSNDDKIWKVAGTIGIHKEYGAYTMELMDRDIKEKLLETEALTMDNLKTYVVIFNEAFNDMPHGCYRSAEEMQELMMDKDNNKEFFIVKYKGEPVGFIETTIEDDEGFFDLGLRASARGKNLGRRLLETAISILREKNTDKICLTVIERNAVAFEMYKRRGFEIKNVYSYWTEISDTHKFL